MVTVSFITSIVGVEIAPVIFPQRCKPGTATFNDSIAFIELVSLNILSHWSYKFFVIYLATACSP